MYISDLTSAAHVLVAFDVVPFEAPIGSYSPSNESSVPVQDLEMTTSFSTGPVWISYPRQSDHASLSDSV